MNRCEAPATGRKNSDVSKGRPRNPEVEQRILTAALQHLREFGYSRMSIEAIASEAGVSKPTIYRRWADKADLATAALMLLRVAEPALTKGSSKGQLKSALHNFRKSLLRPYGFSLIGTVLAEEEHTPTLIALFRKRIVDPRRQILTSILTNAKETGEIRAGADLAAAVNMLVGSFYARYLSGEPISTAWVERIVEVVWCGIA